MDLEFLGDSSCVQAAGWQGGYLTVQFQDGKIYTYEQVPVGVWRNLKTYTSKGYFYNKNIRNVYSFFEGSAPDTGPLTNIDAPFLEDIGIIE